MKKTEQNAVQEWVEKQLQPPRFVAVSSAQVPSEKMESLAVQHLNYLAAVEQARKPFAAGSFLREGVRFGDGTAIFITTSIEEAKSLVDEEPFIKEGFRT